VERDPRHSNEFKLEYDHPQSIGKVKDFHGHFLMMVRAYTYICELGRDGVKKAGEDAVLLANYIRKRLETHYDIAFDRACMHEVVFSDKRQQANGIKTLDIAKRLIDKGFHPPTVYFPLVVSGALMIEPTETESLSTIDKFCDAMIEIAEEAKEPEAMEKYFKNAPRNAPVGKVNETKAAKDLILTWNNL
jgi:glycine dehydrogenase subunit 2